MTVDTNRTPTEQQEAEALAADICQWQTLRHRA
nr:MAG TPA: hypothetical protein [Caudoviricetes sp.]